jgi:hypothetical protein
MAKQTVVSEILIDDLDGGTAERTVRFSWDGIAYELELSKKNAQAFERVLKPYVSAARKAKSSRTRRSTSSRTGKRDLAPVRQWAAKNGYPVSARGRVAQSIIDAFDAAN